MRGCALNGQRRADYHAVSRQRQWQWQLHRRLARAGWPFLAPGAFEPTTFDHTKGQGSHELRRVVTIPVPVQERTIRCQRNPNNLRKDPDREKLKEDTNFRKGQAYGRLKGSAAAAPAQQPVQRSCNMLERLLGRAMMTESRGEWK